jgi:type I restriction enzyme S subunit
MSEQETNIPKLRFPKFAKSAEWDFVGGDELFEHISNKNHNSDLPILSITQEFGAIPRDMIDYSVVVTDKSIESYKVVEKGDFIISLRTFQGGIEYSNYKGICSPAYIILKKKNDEIENLFFKYYFKTDLYIRQLNKNLEGIRDGKMVSYKQFSEIKLPFPSKHEQHHIASCLSSLDELIEIHSQKLELLKTHKKGLVQNLFPTQGANTPKVRFKEYKEEWVEKMLGEVGEVLMCKRIFAEETNPNGGIPFFKIGTFGRVADAYISIEKYNEYRSKYSFPNVGDILISAAGTIGRLVVYDGLPAYFQDSNIVWLGNNENEVLNSFLFYCYSTLKWQTSDGGIINRLYNSDLKVMRIFSPKNKKEQKKIASCLSSLDTLITAHAEKIEQLKLHKKGLMQNLFPQ